MFDWLGLGQIAKESVDAMYEQQKIAAENARLLHEAREQSKFEMACEIMRRQNADIIDGECVRVDEKRIGHE